MNFNFHSHPTFPNCGKRSLRKFLRILTQTKVIFNLENRLVFVAKIFSKKTRYST